MYFVCSYNTKINFTQNTHTHIHKGTYTRTQVVQVLVDEVPQLLDKLLQGWRWRTLGGVIDRITSHTVTCASHDHNTKIQPTHHTCT